MKKAEDRDSVIVRVYNPTDCPIEGMLKTALPCEKVYQVRMDESRETELSIEDGAISLQVPKGKVISIELV